MIASDSAVPWYRLVLHTPLTTLAIFVAASLILKENYPFSHFPMYSSPTAPRAYYMVTDAEGRPLPISTITGVTPPKIGKMHWRKSQERESMVRRTGKHDTAGRNEDIGRRSAMLRQQAADGANLPQGINCFASRLSMTTAKSKRQNNFFSRNNRGPLGRLTSGFFSLPSVSPLEGFFLRLFFGLVVAYTLRFEVPFSTQPHPAGLARFFDLTWLSDAWAYSVFRGALYVLLIFYVGGLILPVALPLLALGHVLVFTLYNSQGYTHHGFQIVSLTLVAQAATVIYYTALKGLRLRPPDERLNAWLLWKPGDVAGHTSFPCFKDDQHSGLWL
jgi:hypothetical protein